MFFNKYGVKSNNIILLYYSMLVGGAIFFLPILALYFEKTLFTITNVAIIFSVQAVATAAFEIPTGAIADLFGRKRTLVFANLFVFIGLIFLYFGSTMKFFIIFALFNALGRSLWSGTDGALIFDTLKEENKEHNYKKIIGTYYALWPIGAAAGSVVGGHLAKISLSLPIIFSVIPISTALILTLFLKEPKYEKAIHRNLFRQMVESLIDVFKNKQILLIFLFGFILFSFGESAHILKSIFLEFKEIPIVYFGYVFGFTFGFSSLGHYFSHDISGKLGNKATLILSALAFPIFLLLAAVTSNLTSIIFIILTAFPFGLRNPVMMHLLNLEISASKRATTLSALNFVKQIGIVIFVPFLGYFADLYTINTAFMIAAFLMFTSVIVALFLKEKN